MPRYVAWPVATLATLMLLYFSRPLLVPVFLAILISQLLVPIVARLERRLPRSLAIVLSLGMIGAVLGVIMTVATEQAVVFQKNVPELQQRLGILLLSAQEFATRVYGVAPVRQMELLKNASAGFVGAGSQLVVTALGMTLTIVANAALVAILAFLMLFYRKHFRRHATPLLAKWAAEESGPIIDRILELGQKYVAGLLSVVGIVAVLDTIGLLLVGAPYPVFFGMLGGLSVLVPFVGIFMVAPICTLLTYVATGSIAKALAIVVVLGVNHLAEGNIITPKLVGRQVNLNPLTSILAVLLGGELWGPAGMLLFIPLAGFLELAFELIPGAEPFAELMGNVPKERRRP